MWCGVEKVFSTVTTCGYGDVLTNRSTQRLYAIFVMSAGVMMQGFLISKLATLFIKANMQSEHREKMLETADMMMQVRQEFMNG